MDIHKVDRIIQYALAVAGQEDDYIHRELGPIHLIKYAYLADITHAEHSNGQSYTGVPWQFHKFGPWSYDLFNRIDVSLSSVNARRKEISHPKYEDDFIRWRLEDDELLTVLEASLPIHIFLSLKEAVHRFGSDTPSLLNHVYLTRPMLKAKPGEFLDLREVAPIKLKADPTEKDSRPEMSTKQKRDRSKSIDRLRNRIKVKLAEKKKGKKLIPPDPSPRYDEVFQQGCDWLDSLAGEPILKEHFTVRFSDDVWKSRARYDPEIP